MKLKKEFITHTANGQAMLVATGNAAFHGLVKGNQTLGVILDLLKEECTEEDLVKKMRGMYEAPEGVIEKDVKKILEKLREIGALDE